MLGVGSLVSKRFFERIRNGIVSFQCHHAAAHFSFFFFFQTKFFCTKVLKSVTHKHKYTFYTQNTTTTRRQDLCGAS